MTEEEDLKQQIIAELEDISPGLMKDVLKTIRDEKALEDEEDEKETHAALLESGSIPWVEVKKELGLAWRTR